MTPTVAATGRHSSVCLGSKLWTTATYVAVTTNTAMRVSLPTSPAADLAWVVNACSVVYAGARIPAGRLNRAGTVSELEVVRSRQDARVVAGYWHGRIAHLC